MPRYIEGPEVKFTENDKIFVDAEFYSGEKFTELELHRMFPITGLTKYIALLDKEGNEIAVIRNIDDLLPESKKDVENIIIQFWESKNLHSFKVRYEVWMERQKKCGRSDNTIYKYEADYKRFFEKDKFEGMRVQDITDECISEFIEYLKYLRKEQYFSRLSHVLLEELQFPTQSTYTNAYLKSLVPDAL